MQKNIKATNIQITPAISDYIEKRFSAFDKYIHDPTQGARCDVEVGMVSRRHKSGNIFRAEVNLHFSGKNFYAISEKDDLYSAIDTVKDEIAHSITSFKGKSMAVMRHRALQAKNLMKGLDWRKRR